MAVKFTEKAEKVLQLATAEAQRQSHGYVGTEHILWALLGQRDSVAVPPQANKCRVPSAAEGGYRLVIARL